MFSWIARAYNWATGKIDNTVASWVHDVISGIWGFLHSLFRVVISSWDRLYLRVKDFVQKIEEFGLEVANWVFWWLHEFWPKWLAWIRLHILQPLQAAWHWITHEGAVTWHYISHPADLVNLIFDPLIAKIEAEAWSVGEKLGKFLLTLIYKNVKPFAELIEDIINAVF